MTAKWLLLPVTFLLATSTTLAQTSPAAAPGGAPPGVSSREMQEDVAVFRVLFNRALGRHYGLPVSEKSSSNMPHPTHPIVHHPVDAEGVYLKGHGVVFNVAAPPPLSDPLAAA